MRYRDVVQEDYEKVKYDEDSDDEGKGGRFGKF